MALTTCTPRGRLIELVEPIAAEVDFREIAAQLANINRYTGGTETPISVAYHTEIAILAAPEQIRPWLALHDCHETRTGDVGTPQFELFVRIARDMFGLPASDIVRQTIEEAKHRHDVVIHAAAGLPMPTAEQRAEIRKADLIALATERRDFLAPARSPWSSSIEAVKPMNRHFRFKAAPRAADDLYALFQTYLPALQIGRNAR